MTIDIDAIRKRLDAASVGPWETGEDGLVWPPHTGDPVSGSIWLPDAEFIAHARTDIPALLAELDRVREVVEAAKAWGEAWEALKGDDSIPYAIAQPSANLHATLNSLPNEQEPCDICSGYGCPDCREGGA